MDDIARIMGYVHAYDYAPAKASEVIRRADELSKAVRDYVEREAEAQGMYAELMERIGEEG